MLSEVLSYKRRGYPDNCRKIILGNIDFMKLKWLIDKEIAAGTLDALQSDKANFIIGSE